MNIIPTHVTFEQAKWLRAKAFQEPTNHYYFEDGEFREHSLTGTNGYYGEEYEFNLEEFLEDWNTDWLTMKDGSRCFGCSKERGYLETYSAPEQWQVIEWLRVNHGIVLLPIYDVTSKHFGYNIITKETSNYTDPKYAGWETPQEAYSAAFDYILKELI